MIIFFAGQFYPVEQDPAICDQGRGPLGMLFSYHYLNGRQRNDNDRLGWCAVRKGTFFQEGADAHAN